MANNSIVLTTVQHVRTKARNQQTSQLTHKVSKQQTDHNNMSNPEASHQLILHSLSRPQKTQARLLSSLQPSVLLQPLLLLQLQLHCRPLVVLILALLRPLLSHCAFLRGGALVELGEGAFGVDGGQQHIFLLEDFQILADSLSHHPFPLHYASPDGRFAASVDAQTVAAHLPRTVRMLHLPQLEPLEDAVETLLLRDGLEPGVVGVAE